MATTYKQTEIGLMPEDWEDVRFTRNISLKHGFQFLEHHFSSSGVPVIKIGTLVDSGGIDKTKFTFVSQSDAEKFKVVKLNFGDVLMALTGATLGKVSLLDFEGECLQNYRVGNFICDENILKPFVYHILQSFLVQKTVKDLVNSGAQPNLGKADFEKIRIPLPPLSEQQAIAQTLSDTDAWIESLKSLIVKKRLIKQGAMQQLLTPKPDWEVKKLGEVGFFNPTNSLSREKLDYVDGDFYNIHYGDIHTKFKLHFKLLNEKVPFIKKAHKLTNYTFCSIGDLIIADASEDEADIGKAIEIVSIDNRKVVAGLHTLHFKPQPNLFQVGFLGFIWQSSGIKAQLLKGAQGTKVLSISATRLNDMNIAYPSLPEQTRIAIILSDMDAEIEALEQKLGKARQLKQGMMQVLLTGKVRLV